MSTMPFDDIERAYETLAQAIDQAGPQQEALFLAKLALLLAHEVGQFERFRHCVEAALADLPKVAAPAAAPGLNAPT